MKIEKITVRNFRLLKTFSISIEDDLSLIIGKNNAGKTSFLSVLDKFLNKSDSIAFDDFNVDLKSELKEKITAVEMPPADSFEAPRIEVCLYITFNKVDKCDRIENLLTTLDPENNYLLLQFSYELNHSGLKELRSAYATMLGAIAQDAKSLETKKDVFVFLKNNHQKFFKVRKRSLHYDMSSGAIDFAKSIDIDKEKISLSEVINFKYISAKREVTNKEIDKTLSAQIAKLYKKSSVSADQEKAVETFKDQLIETDVALSSIYADLFKDVLKKVKSFGGNNSVESALQIMSSLQHRELLEGNTTVMYSQAGHSLPESYNGLGYMNLLSIIFEIEIIIREIRRDASERPAELNLLLIEEPEAHTHPQLQYVFIKNIKELVRTSKVRDDGIFVPLQYIISTHSAHIVAESEFDDIKYFIKDGSNSVRSRNLKDLHAAYEAAGQLQSYKFLKQYLTLSRAELFFADKAILIEGDTERILLPAMMKQLDGSGSPSLMSQNISIVEVGAHSQVFEKFIDFLSIKSLIITDVDSYYDAQIICEKTGIGKTDKDGNPETETIQCPANHPLATHSSNYSLRFFYGTLLLSDLSKKTIGEKTFSKKDSGWVPDASGQVCVIYQTIQDGYAARSFEDAFFQLNSSFIKSVGNTFDALTPKWLDKFKSGEVDAFCLAEKGVKSKPSLAIEILLNGVPSEEDDPLRITTWTAPAYLVEGLEWLRKEKADV